MASILLRPWQNSDLDNLVKYANNKNVANMLMDRFPSPFTPEIGEEFIQRNSRHTPENVLAITNNGQAIGGIGIHPLEDIFMKNGELGYWLAEEFWGQGIMTRAVPQMVNYVFNNFALERIFARPFGSNLGSQRVLEKCGFILEATLYQTIFKNGKFEDELIYAIRK